MRLTVGIPFFNNETTLGDAIRSVFAQTFEDWELILLDDGSVDRSLEIAGAVKDPRVKVISDGLNRGLSHRLNQIAEVARGEFVARMDADDLLHPERFARQIGYLDANRAVDVVGTGMYAIDSANNPVGKRGCEPTSVTARGLLVGKGPAHATVVARTAWLRENRYDGDFRRSQDYELWCRSFVKRGTQFGHLPEPLYFVREEGSVSLRKLLASYRSVREILGIYGPALAGWPRTRMQLAKTRLKEALHCLFAIVGKQTALVKRRNIPLSGEEQSSARSVVASILETPVPGLCETIAVSSEVLPHQR